MMSTESQNGQWRERLFIKCLVETKSFVYIFSLNSHNNPMVLIIFAYFKEEETEVQQT